MPPTTKVPLLPTRDGKPRTIEVAPGQTVVEVPSLEVPRLCLAEFVPTGEPNTFRAIARVHSAEIRLTAANLKKLNLGVEPCTLKRLIKAEFVYGGRIAPGCYQFSLASYYAHVKAVRTNPDFWTGENLARYRAAI